MLIYVMNHRLNFSISPLGQHIEEIGKQVLGVIWLLPHGHCKADGITMIVLVISEYVLPGISFLKDARLDVMHKYFTLSHTPVSLC